MRSLNKEKLMDKLEHYCQIIQEILTEHSQVKPVYGEIAMKLVFDRPLAYLRGLF
jgi:hypothetical protein